MHTVLCDDKLKKIRKKMGTIRPVRVFLLSQMDVRKNPKCLILLWGREDVLAGRVLERKIVRLQGRLTVRNVHDVSENDDHLIN